MTKITIPPAALEAGAALIYAADHSGQRLADASELTRRIYIEAARAAFEAMVASWPGMDTIMLPRMMQPGHFVPQDYIRLPLTETHDDKA